MRRIKDRYSSAVYSKTPDKTGLGRMQMYQIRLFPSDQTSQLAPCPYVMQPDTALKKAKRNQTDAVVEIPLKVFRCLGTKRIAIVMS